MSNYAGLYINDEAYEIYIHAKDIGLAHSSEYEFCKWLLDGNELAFGPNFVFSEECVDVVPE